MSVDRDALAKAVSEKSPLSLDQIERLFGGSGEHNKAVIWRFLNMTHQQQDAIYQAYLRVKHIAPDTKVEAVR